MPVVRSLPAWRGFQGESLLGAPLFWLDLQVEPPSPRSMQGLASVYYLETSFPLLSLDLDFALEHPHLEDPGAGES